MENKTITRVLILGVIVILSMLSFQSYYVFTKWGQENKTFHQTAYIALLNVARKLAKLNNSTLPTKDLIKQLSANYYVVNINNSIDAGVLEQYLIEEFQRRSLKMDFEYGIYDCQTDEMVYGDFCSIAEKEYKNEQLGDLPKYEEFIYYFGVKFPNKTRFLIDNLSLAIAFSLISLLAIVFFVYSVLVILRQKRLSELQKDFINNMTHEFKTPISSIKLASETLIKSPLIAQDPKLLQYSNIIQNQNERINDQIEKILNIAKMEKDQFTLNKELVDLHTILEDMTKTSRLKMQAREGHFDLQLDADQSEIQADKLHLVNLLSNLIDNAVKYSKGRPQVTIKTRDKNNKLVLTIEDNGIGISEEHIKRIFTKFYRVPTGNLHNVKGFGLGLYYVKNVCDAHDWDIQAESVPGGGTRMQITI